LAPESASLWPWARACAQNLRATLRKGSVSMYFFVDCGWQVGVGVEVGDGGRAACGAAVDELLLSGICVVDDGRKVEDVAEIEKFLLEDEAVAFTRDVIVEGAECQV
jgi:hypothetical protein